MSEHDLQTGQGEKGGFSFPVPVHHLILILLLAVTVIVFWQVKGFEFLYLDDDVYVFNNLHIRDGLTWKGFLWALTADVFSNTVNADYWQPVTILSRMLDVELFKLNAGGHHVTNLVIHVFNVWLLFLVLRRLTGAEWRSGFAAALFAVHPMQVEAVAWVTARKDVLSALFALLAIWAYVRWRENEKGKWKGLFYTFYILGLMSKPVLITLPFGLLLLDYWPIGRIKAEPFVRSEWKQALIEKWPMMLLAFFSFSITMIVITQAIEPSLWVKIANGSVSYVRNVARLLYPDRLAVWYLHPGVDPNIPMIPVWKVAACAAAFFALTVLALSQFKKRPYVVMGWLWYVGMIAPAVGLRPRDRAMYLPMIGLLILLSWGGEELTRRLPYRRAVRAAAASLIILVLMIVSGVYVGYWRNTIPLFEHTLAVTEENDLIRTNLAVVYTERGRRQEAIDLYEAVIRHNPEDAVAHNNIGNVLVDVDRVEEAIRHYQESLRLRPDYSEAYNNLGNAYKKLGKMEEAMASFQNAVRLNPLQYVAIYNVAQTLIDTGKPEEAVPLFQRILEINPYYLGIYVEYGKLLERLGRKEEALTLYMGAAQREPAFTDANLRAADLLSASGRFRDAVGFYEQGLRTNPNNALAAHALANALANIGEYQKAIGFYSESIRLNPNDPRTHFNIGNSLAALEYYDSAAEHYKTALSLYPGYIEAHLNLGNCYVKTGKFEEAVASYRQVLQTNPADPGVQYNTGFVLEALGRLDEAKRHYAEALRLKPDYEDARKRVEALQNRK